MPIRRLAFALCLTLLAAGCMTQRDSADMNDASGDDDMAASDTTEADTATTRGGMPNIPVYLDGTWDFTATEIGGDETITGTLTIAEQQGASRLAASNGIDAPLTIEAMEVTNASFVLDGTVQSEPPRSVALTGSLAGDEMTAEAEVEGLGTFALTGTRRGE